MVAIVTVLLAFPLGYLVRSRTAALLAYVAAFGYTFTFQSIVLLRAWTADPTEAFPADPDAVPWAYALVTLAIYAAGLGLVVLGHRVAARRRLTRSAVAP